MRETAMKPGGEPGRGLDVVPLLGHPLPLDRTPVLIGELPAPVGGDGRTIWIDIAVGDQMSTDLTYLGGLAVNKDIKAAVGQRCTGDCVNQSRFRIL